jgi:hypothetical protein
MSSLRRRLAAAEVRMKIVKHNFRTVVFVNHPDRLGDTKGHRV